VTRSLKIPLLFAALLCVSVLPLRSQPGGEVTTGPVDTVRFHTRWIRLGVDTGGLLYEPNVLGPKSHIALVQTHPQSNNFYLPGGRELASRGYRVLLIDYHGRDLAPEAMMEDYLPSLSRGVAYLRTQPGVDHVLVMGHSGGAAMTLLYGAVSTVGPSACQGPEKIYPCNGSRILHLEKADGFVVLDSPLGAFERMSGIDAAWTDHGRDRSLDMFDPANGYDTMTKEANYSPAFVKHYYEQQRAHHMANMALAEERLKAIEVGRSAFDDDELLQIRDMGPNIIGARLFEADLRLAHRTKKPHIILKADGSQVEAIAESVRPPQAQAAQEGLRKLNVMSVNTTVRHFLATFALRTTPDYAITEDDIKGVDWHSAYNAPPSNAEKIAAPTLVMANSCMYLIVPDEIIYDHLAAKDKTYAITEGASHDFVACRPQYGDTKKRVYDFVDNWLSKPGRF
jgi:pimeloyl-ACP methyl ester carboxylesterase